jgi:hypothetical protein
MFSRRQNRNDKNLLFFLILRIFWNLTLRPQEMKNDVESCPLPPIVIHVRNSGLPHLSNRFLCPATRIRIDKVVNRAHKKSRPGQGRLRMGLVKDTPFVISEAPFTSGGEWTKFYRRRQTTANGDDFNVARFVPIKSERWRIRLARMLLFDVRSKVVEKTLRFRSPGNAV